MITGLVRGEWSNSPPMLHQLAFTRNPTGWPPHSGGAIERWLDGGCRSTEFYNTNNVHLCRSTTTQATTSPPQGQLKLRFPPPFFSCSVFEICAQKSVFHYCLAFVFIGWHCAHQQLQLPLWPRCPQDRKILCRLESWRLSGDLHAFVLKLMATLLVRRILEAPSCANTVADTILLG